MHVLRGSSETLPSTWLTAGDWTLASTVFCKTAPERQTYGKEKSSWIATGEAGMKACKSTRQSSKARTKEWSVLVPRDVTGSKLESTEKWVVPLHCYQKTFCFVSKRMATSSLHVTAMLPAAVPPGGQRYPKKEPWAVALLEMYRGWSFWRWKEEPASTVCHSAHKSKQNPGQHQPGGDCSGSFVLKFFTEPIWLVLVFL